MVIEQSNRDRSNNELDRNLFLEEIVDEQNELAEKIFYLIDHDDENQHNIEDKNENFDFEQRKLTDSI